MAQNFNLGGFGQFITTNVTSNTITFVANTTQLVIANNVSINANGTNGTSGQALTTNGSAVYWSTIVGTNTAAQYTWSNTQTFSNAITFSGNVVIQSGLSANGGFGTTGQVLTSNGTTGSPYWATAAGGGSINLASSYAFTNVTASANATSGAITTAGGLGVANNLYVGGRVGFANTTSSVVYQIYNATTGSLDTVFG